MVYVKIKFTWLTTDELEFDFGSAVVKHLNVNFTFSMLKLRLLG